MKLGKKEQVFKVHWVEELKILCRIVCVPAIIIYQGIIISSQFLTSKKEIFLGYFLIALLSIIAFIILSIYIFNKKVDDYKSEYKKWNDRFWIQNVKNFWK